MGLRKSYLRWRHSKGFGVHSPYAYRFVKDVLRPGAYGFYSYNEIDRYLKKQERHDYGFSCLIKFSLRLVIFLKARRIVSSSESRLSGITAKVLDISWKDLKKFSHIDFMEGDLLIVDSDEISVSFVSEAISCNVPVFAINPSREVRGLLETPLEKGLLLEDKKTMILIPRQEMQYVSYEMRLNIGVRV